MKHMFKNGLIRANKAGGQYRILGKELIRLVSPELKNARHAVCFLAEPSIDVRDMLTD